MHPAFQHHRYLIRRKFLTLAGAKLHVFDDNQRLLLYCQMKAFKLKEDITIFGDEAMTQPLLRIKARRIIDFAATYDVFDITTGTEYHIGALRRKGMKSIIRDEWLILNTTDGEIGLIQEDSGALAIVRRFIDLAAMFLPQSYNFSISGRPMGTMKQTFNPFIMKMTADFTQDPQGYLDRRLAAAAATLLCVIEGKQR
ncbi:hypothetical protein HZA57_04720 [Candidatus Poribacteria bacterium]|nr:hypothetical protein [Candidatus Poribacteria bacterium]